MTLGVMGCADTAARRAGVSARSIPEWDNQKERTMNMKMVLLISAIACFAGAATAQRESPAKRTVAPMHVVNQAPPAIGTKSVQGGYCFPICHPICGLIPCCDC